MKSEFGKGLIICLVKFSEHLMHVASYLKTNQEMRKISAENSKLFSDESAVRLWANGATDHLYEIEVPKGEEWNYIRGLVKKLQDKGLDMGHGSGLMGKKKFTEEDVEKLETLTRKIALAIDKKLGLKPELGKW